MYNVWHFATDCSEKQTKKVDKSSILYGQNRWSILNLRRDKENLSVVRSEPGLEHNWRGLINAPHLQSRSLFDINQPRTRVTIVVQYLISGVSFQKQFGMQIDFVPMAIPPIWFACNCGVILWYLGTSSRVSKPAIKHKMSEPETTPVEEQHSRRSRFNAFLYVLHSKFRTDIWSSHTIPRKEGFKEGLAKGRTEALKGKSYLEHSLGLGHRPNIIPPGEATVNGDLRLVEIGSQFQNRIPVETDCSGWHPVAGFGGKWFAEQTRLGKWVTSSVKGYPDPTQHWAVLVDEYVHELWMVCLQIMFVEDNTNKPHRTSTLTLST